MASLLAAALLSAAWGRAGVVEIPYSEYQRLVEAGEVTDVVVTPSQIRGSLRSERDGRSRFVTLRVDESVAAGLDSAGVEYRGRPDATAFGRLLAFLAPLALLAGFYFLLFRRFSGGAGRPGAGLFSVGKSRARVYVENETRVGFRDVAGVEEAKQDLGEIVSFLREPAAFARLGARVPRGVLLVGPPGTGKTLLARAVAGEAGVPFFSISGSEFVELFVGVGAARVRDLFQQARAKAPCIVFIDELDALGRARGAFGGGGNDEKEQTLNQLLVELDGFDAQSGVILLGATNRPEVLDPALLRAGRFDRQVVVDRPDREGRLAILRVHAESVALAPRLDLEQIAALTPGFTGADLANLVNEAALVATRRGAERVELTDFTAAVERVVAGSERRGRLLGERERRVVAHHEMGHALVALSLPGADPVHKVSIIPRGSGALGYTLQRPSEERFLSTRQELEDRLCVLLGGRAAERLVFDHLSTGAADDLARATEIARDMVTRFGMAESLGNVVYAEERSRFLTGMGDATRSVSPETAQRIDEAVRRLVDGALDRADGLLRSHRELLESSAERLLEVETLGEEELAAYARDLNPAEAA